MRRKRSPSNATGYRFLDQDPVVDLCRFAMDRAGFRFSQIIQEANHSIAEGTVRNIAYGKTRRPMHNTVRTIIEACGGREVFVFPGPDGHDMQLAGNYDAKSAKDAIRMRNGHGWRSVEPIHPKIMRQKQAAMHHKPTGPKTKLIAHQ